MHLHRPGRRLLATRRRFLLGGAAIGLAAATGTIAACGDDDLDVPVDDAQALRALFDPRVAPLDQRVTRIGLYDLEGGYVRDPRGDHLAVYVEPIDPAGAGWTPERYVERLAPGVAACAPFIFETWADVASMDICQEPPQDEAPEEEPPVETQVVLHRADAATIDWDSVELVDLLLAELRRPDTVRVAGRVEVDQHPTWRAAERAAQARFAAES